MKWKDVEAKHSIDRISHDDHHSSYSNLIESIWRKENQKIFVVFQRVEHRRFVDRWTSRKVTIFWNDPTDSRTWLKIEAFVIFCEGKKNQMKTHLFMQNPLKKIFNGEISAETCKNVHFRIELMVENVRRDEFFSC